MLGRHGSQATSPKGDLPGCATFLHRYALYIIIFTVELGLGIVAPILPDIGREFSLSSWQIGMMVTVYATARLITDVPLGLLLDRVDRTKILVLGSVIVVVGSVGCGLAGDYLLLLGSRLAMGTGTALCLLTALYTVSRSAGADSRGRVVGIYKATQMAGVTISPAMGGAAAALAGWRASFFFAAFAGIVAMLMTMVASRLGILKLPPTSHERERPGNPSPQAVGQGRIPWNLVAINFTTFVFFLSTSGFRNSMVPVYGGNELGIGAATLGLLLGGSGVIRFLVTLGSGIASDRYGRKAILFPGTVFLAAGTWAFMLARDDFGFAIALFTLSLGGFGNSLPTTMVVDAVRGGRMGTALGVNRFVGDLGMMLGPVTLGLILDVAGFSSVAAVTAVVLLTTIPGVALTVRDRRGSKLGAKTPRTVVG